MLQFNQSAREILGMQEQDRLAMCTDLGLAIAKHTRAFGQQGIARLHKIMVTSLGKRKRLTILSLLTVTLVGLSSNMPLLIIPVAFISFLLPGLL